MAFISYEPLWTFLEPAFSRFKGGDGLNTWREENIKYIRKAY